MIIYQAMPCRIYPHILENILNKISISSFEFWQIYNLTDETDYNKENNIMGSIPNNIKHPRFDGFLYGAFSSKTLNKKDKDFVFTIINHPIQQIYEIYARWKFLYTDSYDKELKNFFKNSIGDSHPEIIQSNRMISLQEYIDKILNNEDFIFKYKDINYTLLSEIIFGYPNKNFNFIGKTSNLNFVEKKLSEVFDCRIEFNNITRILSYQGDQNYRIKDLEIMFKDQIDYYNSLT